MIFVNIGHGEGENRMVGLDRWIDGQINRGINGSIDRQIDR
jgi:hypothetical protein